MKGNGFAHLRNLLNSTESSRQLTPEEIDSAIHLARNNESVNRYDPGLPGVAKYLAQTGGLNEVYKAIELALESKDDRWSRHFVLAILAERLIIAGDMPRVYELISQIEKDATSVEDNNDYWPAQKAQMWETIADLYFRLGNEEKVSFVVANASRIATAGQFDMNAQEAYECEIILRGLVGKLMSIYRFATALKIVETSDWHDKTAWIDALNTIIASDIRYQR
jgi:hypothetical protein